MQKLSKKILNICIVFVIIITIIFISMLLILNYNENGETNMPFKISKISIISCTDGQNVENPDFKWAIDVIQNNDINIYIEKNEENKKQETIKNIKLFNFQINESPKIGELKFYRPIDNTTSLFKNSDENQFETLEFTGSKSTNTKKLEISNQGGIIQFRCANSKIGTYTSNDDQEINYNELLKKLNIDESTISAGFSFDMEICLNSGTTFKAEQITLKIPNENIVNQGTVGVEYTDLQDIVFKR